MVNFEARGERHFNDIFVNSLHCPGFLVSGPVNDDGTFLFEGDVDRGG